MTTPTSIGEYRVLRELGRGSCGEVLLAEHSAGMGFRRRVAIKRLIQLPHTDESRFDALERALISEARLGGHLRHSNIVGVQALDRDHNGWFLVMDLIDGITLAQLILRVKTAGEAIPPSIALQLMEQVLLALDYAHRLKDDEGKALRVVHRDIKPANLMLARDGRAMLTDFGIARAASNLDQTRTGVLKGTPAYMSPEQATGRRNIDFASDIFSAAAVLYELLTLRQLFYDLHPVRVMKRIVHEDPTERLEETEALAPGASRVLRRALAKDPRRRFGSARSMARALAGVRKGFGEGASPQRLAARWVDNVEAPDPLRQASTWESDRS